MPTLENIKKHQKIIITTILFVISLPLISVLTKIIFTYGTYIGTIIRNISETGACF